MKLIELLVKELPNRGGWPEAANYVVQDYDGTVKFSKSINFLHIKAGEWCSNKDGDDWIYGDRPFEGNFHHYTIAQDRNSSIVTREQYESALAASDGWIEWSGGKCPVDSDAIVEVKCRNQNQYQHNNDRAGDFSWAHDGFGCDIIAYRLHKPDANSRANDDRLEQDLNERIGHGVYIPEWNGDGIPPVGIECEFKCATGEWVAVEITAIARNGVCFVERGKNGENYVPFISEFRPLCTEAEKARDAAAKEMARHANSDQHRKFNAGLRNCLSIYDAIAAGKIPGVKLEGK